MALSARGAAARLKVFRAKPFRFLRLAAALRHKRRLPLIPVRKPHKVYGRIGDLEVRLARSKGDLRRAQRLRYDVFYKEMAATPDGHARRTHRDEDKYDPVCDHLLVIDKSVTRDQKRPWLKKPAVVGTYRIMRQQVAERTFGFYTQGEYDIAPLIERKRHTHRFLELGRSCVLKPYRNKRTVELLWQGLWTYIREHGMDVMLGCASFPGVDPQEHAMALSFLHHFSRAPDDWMVRAHADQRVDMNMMPKEAVDAKAALKAMPPLIKGYLRLGAFVGDGAVVDRQFGTTDVFIILPVEVIDPRYFGHFGAPDEVLPISQPRRTRRIR
jgi:putative hemolysin